MRSRARIYVPLAFVTIAIVAVVFIRFSKSLRNDITQSVMQTAADQAQRTLEAELTGLFNPIGAQLKITERWGERGLFSIDDHTRLNALFMPMLEQFPYVCSMLIANENGAEYMLLREESGWRTRATDATGNPGKVRWQRWDDEDSMTEESWEDVDYDPRQRPWYQAALEQSMLDEQGIAWAEPYEFFTTRQIGITLSKRWRTGEPEMTYVAGFDVPLESILPVVEGLVDDGESFLFNIDEKVIAAGDGLRTPSPSEAGIIAAWQDAERPTGKPMRVSNGGKTLWFDVRLIPAATGEPPRLAVVMAESAFDGPVRAQQQRYMLLVLGVLALGALVTIPLTQVMAGRAGRKVRDLESEAGLQAAIAAGESDQLEFKSTMRWNLQRDKAGKEVEIAWLKSVVAFMNTEGGAILIGVNDDGEVLGIEGDRFANDDKFLLHFNNLIKEHVGLSFSSFIRANLRPLGDKQVFVIECRPANEPAFLKKGNEEQFYIRVGPSSRQLPPSEVVKRFRGKS